MEPVLITTKYQDLYRLLAAMEVMVYENCKPENILIWSPEASSKLLNGLDKLEVVNRYAGKLGVNVVLSAASDTKLRKLAKVVGWKVVWEIPTLDESANLFGFNPNQISTAKQLAS
jgi:hypothetical protein